MSDALRWIVVFVVFLFGFSSALFVLQDDVYAILPVDSDSASIASGDVINGGDGWSNRMNKGFQILTGGFSPDDAVAASLYPRMASAISIIYVLLIAILMLNILIAMMSKSFEDVWGSADVRWHLERARIIAGIQEERFSELENKYWIDMPASEDAISCSVCNPQKYGNSTYKKLKHILRVDAEWHKPGGSQKKED